MPWGDYRTLTADLSTALIDKGPAASVRGRTGVWDTCEHRHSGAGNGIRYATEGAYGTAHARDVKD